MQQNALPGECIPQFAVALPVFGPAGPIPRVNAEWHPALTVTMKEIDQAVLPVNNRELIYYFHGLTDSGDFYVEAILPLQAPFLAADEDPASPLPPGGIPFKMDNLGSYFQDVANKLNATPPDGFTPSLTTLDALIQSIFVGTAP